VIARDGEQADAGRVEAAQVADHRIDERGGGIVPVEQVAGDDQAADPRSRAQGEVGDPGEERVRLGTSRLRARPEVLVPCAEVKVCDVQDARSRHGQAPSRPRRRGVRATAPRW